MSITVMIDDTSDCLLQRYRLVAKLDGHKGSINCFAFNNSSSLLASGGDDEIVQVWDMNNLQSIQTIADRNHRWGQITCLKFISADTTSDWMCFGTGRGRFLVYRRLRKSVGGWSADIECTDRSREQSLWRYHVLEYSHLVTASKVFVSILFTTGSS